MIKTVVATAILSLSVLSAGTAIAQPTTTPAPVIDDPCLHGEPIDTTVVTPDGKPADPAPYCPPATAQK